MRKFSVIVVVIESDTEQPYPTTLTPDIIKRSSDILTFNSLNEAIYASIEIENKAYEWENMEYNYSKDN